MKFIEHCTSELIRESSGGPDLRVGATCTISEMSQDGNNLVCLVREVTGDTCRVDIVEGDLAGVAEEDRVTTVGVLPKGYYVTRDDDGDWVLVPPRDATIFSVPGEAVLLATMSDSKQDAVTEAAQYLQGIEGVTA